MVLYRTDASNSDRYRCRCAGRKRHRSCRQRRRSCRGGGTVKHMMRKATTHLTQNEGLIFEKSRPARRPISFRRSMCPRSTPLKLLGEPARTDLGELPGSERGRNHPPLHAALHLELRHRSGHVPAGLLHHEVQPARQRIVARLEGSPGRIRISRRRSRRAHWRSWRARATALLEITGMDADHAAARGRRAWRDDRHPADPRASRSAGQSAQEDPDSRFGARHQSRHRGDRAAIPVENI